MMNIEEKHHELIDKFLLHSLNEIEQKEFEQLLEEADFKTELAFKQHLFTAAVSEGRAALKTRFSALEENANIPTATQGKRILMLSWSIAAAAVLFIGVFALRFLFSQNIDNQTLVAQYFEPYPNVIVPLHRGEAAKDTLTLAMSFYENKHYDEGIALLKKLKQQDETDFYIALMLMASKQYSEANYYLDALSRHENRFEAEANWYIALNNLALHKTDVAKQQLTMIAQDDKHLFKQKAIALKSQLR